MQPYKTKPECLRYSGTSGDYTANIETILMKTKYHMKYCDYEKALSRSRLNRYLNACNGDETKALYLYRNNVNLCQRFYGILCMFEIILRNSINDHYINKFKDNDWIKHNLSIGGILEHHPQKGSAEKTISNLSQTHRYSNDKVVAAMSMGFWTHLFNKEPFLRGGQSLLQIFPNKEHGLGQRSIYNELQKIKNFRNRIAHYEAICFYIHGKINVLPSQDIYNLIIKYIHFLGYSKDELFYKLDTLPGSGLPTPSSVH